MTTVRPVVAGIDGSAESVAAAHWAAGEAMRRGAPLHLLGARLRQAGDPVGGTGVAPEQAQDLLEAVGADIATWFPALEITTEQSRKSAPAALGEASERAGVLVLGARKLGAVAGVLLGSVGLRTVARAACPVVMVRAGEEQAGPAVGGGGSVVLGVEAVRPSDDAVVAFAFDAAAGRGVDLYAVHAWGLPPVQAHAPADIDPVRYEELRREHAADLSRTLRPWRERYPRIPVHESVVFGDPAQALVGACPRAGLLVVGRREHRRAPGTRLGPVGHAVLYHCNCPVAVVPHS